MVATEGCEHLSLFSIGGKYPLVYLRVVLVVCAQSITLVSVFVGDCAAIESRTETCRQAWTRVDNIAMVVSEPAVELERHLG
jgi:hypothetical protein